MQPNDPIVGGTVLRRPAIASPNFVSGSTGWSIDANGSAEFNGLVIHGSIVIGTGTNNVIILDFNNRAMFVYDASGHLVESVAASAGVDGLGNIYQAGFTSYVPGNVAKFSNLLGGNMSIGTGTIIETDNQGPGANQPDLAVSSGTAGLTQAVLELFGSDSGNTAAPLARFRGSSVGLDVLIQGIAKWSDPSSVNNYAETWHALPLTVNWSNQGAPFGNGSYKRMPDGTVRFTGAIKWTAAASNAPVQVCTALPANYRPVSQKRCMTMSMPADTVIPQVESLDIHTDGTVWITSFPNGTGPVSPITLDDVSYPLDS